MMEEKDGILGIVAHDLRAPFSNISGLARLFHLSGDVNKDQAEYLEKINYSIDKGNQLITDLLDISNFQNSKAEKPKFEEIHISSLFNELHEQHANTTREKGQKLEFKSFVNVTFNTDKLLLWRILDNLISNAIKYSPEGKSINVKAAFERNCFRFIVQDEGLGFSDEDKKKMFGKFQRLSALPTGGEHSTGLGLSIVKMIVDKLNGTISVNSEVGRGSEFIIEFQAVDHG
jgi:signal transduction histidine kinase